MMDIDSTYRAKQREAMIMQSWESGFAYSKYLSIWPPRMRNICNSNTYFLWPLREDNRANPSSCFFGFEIKSNIRSLKTGTIS